MALREQIRSSPEYQTLTGQENVQGRNQARQQPRQAASPAEALDPILDWTKGDIEFWMQVAQLIVLLLILRELRGV